MAVEMESCSKGGVAFAVILKPAAVPSPSSVAERFAAPCKSISQETINQKLKEATERRRSVESNRLFSVIKDRERVSEANQRIQELNDSFSKEAKKKLTKKMNIYSENKLLYVKEWQEKLKKHDHHVDEVLRTNESCKSNMVKSLKERNVRKLEAAEAKRVAQLESIQERLREHKKQIDRVIEQSKKFSKETEEKILEKMEGSLKLREERLNNLLSRLKDHDRQVDQVRGRRLSQLVFDDSANANNSSEFNASTDISLLGDISDMNSSASEDVNPENGDPRDN